MNRRQFIVGATSTLLASPALATVSLETKIRDKVLSEGESLLGLTHKKKTDRQKLKEYFSEHLGVEVDPRHTPWCAVYCDSVLSASNLQPRNTLLARDFLKYGTKTKSPKAGDIVVLKRGSEAWTGHVGFFVEYPDPSWKGVIRILNGNSLSKVRYTNFYTDKVLGYRSLI